MKSVLIILLIASYIVIAVFGLFGMHLQSDMGMQGHETAPNNCIAVAAKGVDCPGKVDPIGFAAFHINALGDFSLAVLGGNTANALFYLFSSILFVGLAFFSLQLFKPPQFALYRYRLKDSFAFSQQQQLIHWLALHENSPALF